MLHNVLNSGLLADTAIPFAIARIATGSFFALSGFHKLFNSARHRTLVNTLKACGVPCVPAMQWFVPSIELTAGLGLAFGFLTPLAALGLIAICVVATCTDGLKRIRSWQPLDKADAVDDLLYLPGVYLRHPAELLRGSRGRSAELGRNHQQLSMTRERIPL
jgi:uncharacterized membrane protein YphA (DoxX/SURF4 family)